MFTRKAVSAFLGLSTFALLVCSGSKPANAEETSSTVANEAETLNKAAAAAPKPLDFEAYQNLIKHVPGAEEERLCGLDKACITLWKDGKLEVYKDKRIVSGDFNFDGNPDEAFVLEKDKGESDASEKEYYICITTKINGADKVLLHQLIPHARNILEVFWDANKKALIIDTGGRMKKSESVSSFYGGGYTYETGQVLKVVNVVVWNPKTLSFDLTNPFGKMKHSEK